MIPGCINFRSTSLGPISRRQELIVLYNLSWPIIISKYNILLYFHFRKTIQILNVPSSFFYRTSCLLLFGLIKVGELYSPPRSITSVLLTVIWMHSLQLHTLLVLIYMSTNNRKMKLLNLFIAVSRDSNNTLTQSSFLTHKQFC